jgi:hypothetical protein
MIRFALIDLTTFARDILAGAIGDFPMSTVAHPDEACAVMTRLVAEKVGRPLTMAERELAVTAMYAAFTLERSAMRRRLSDAQHCLYRQLRGVA